MTRLVPGIEPIRVRVTSSQGEVTEQVFDTDELLIGRASSCGLILEDRFLSRQHSRLFRQGGELLVEDLGSRNGTLLNGQKVLRPTPVQPGDVLAISNTQIRILEPPDREAPSGEGSPSKVGMAGHTVLLNADSLLQKADSQRSAEDSETLRRYTERLELINDVHRALGQALEQGKLLELILDRVSHHMRPEQAAIFLRREDGTVEKAAARHRKDSTADDIFFSRSLAEEVVQQRNAALVHEAALDERFNSAHSILGRGIRSMVAAPLHDTKGCLGMIVLSSRRAGRLFTEEDLEVLVSLASVAVLSLRNADLLEESAERKRLEKELALGRQIQEKLLPSRLPAVEGYELYAVNLPFRGVSGDYYQILERTAYGIDEIVLMIADVSGKGIAASLVTTSLEALAAGPIEDGHSVDEICRRLSRRLHQRTPPEKYATAFVAALDPPEGRLTYANAGHNEGLVLRHDGSMDILDSTGPPIGLVDPADYRADKTHIDPGDLLILYTDGITEAFNPEDEEFGMDRLSEVCREHRAEPLENLVELLDISLDRFVRGVPYGDDRTLVLLRRLS